METGRGHEAGGADVTVGTGGRGGGTVSPAVNGSCAHMPAATWEAEVPRMTCGGHGVGRLPVPWAEPGLPLTVLSEGLAIDLLEAS